MNQFMNFPLIQEEEPRMVVYFDVSFSHFFLGLDETVQKRPWKKEGYFNAYILLKKLFAKFSAVKNVSKCVAVFDEAEKKLLEYGNYIIVKSESNRTRIDVIIDFLKVKVLNDREELYIVTNEEKNLQPLIQARFQKNLHPQFIKPSVWIAENSHLLDNDVQFPKPTCIVELEKKDDYFGPLLRNSEAEGPIVKENEEKKETFLFDCNNMFYLAKCFRDSRPWAKAGMKFVSDKLIKIIRYHHKKSKCTKSYALFDVYNNDNNDPNNQSSTSTNNYVDDEETKRLWTISKVIIDNKDGKVRLDVLTKSLELWGIDTKYLVQKLEKCAKFRIENDMVITVESKDELLKNTCEDPDGIVVRGARPIFETADDLIVKIIEFYMKNEGFGIIHVITSDAELRERIQRLSKKFKKEKFVDFHGPRQFVLDLSSSKNENALNKWLMKF